MKKITLILFLLVACFTAANAQDLDEQYGKNLLKPGTIAPEFVIDFKDTKRNIPLSHFRGRYVVLEFWASWCPDCRREMPTMKALKGKYHNRGVTFIGVSFDTDKDAWVKYIKENNLNWLQYSELKKWKKETKIDRDYHIDWIPTVYLINPEGKVELATVMMSKLESKLSELNVSLKNDPVVIKPQFSGDKKALAEYLKLNLKYPEEARKMGAEGRVQMSFYVETDGSITQVTAPRCEITGYNQALFNRWTTGEQQEQKRLCMLAMAKEGARVIHNMPKWEPATKDGQPVRMKLNLPLMFKL